jgi:hypothetical protein
MANDAATIKDSLNENNTDVDGRSTDARQAADQQKTMFGTALPQPSPSTIAATVLR